MKKLNYQHYIIPSALDIYIPAINTIFKVYHFTISCNWQELQVMDESKNLPLRVDGATIKTNNERHNTSLI